MTSKEKDSLYKSIINEVAVIVKRRLNEMINNDEYDDFDIRDYLKEYRKLDSFIDKIEEKIRKEDLKESLRPDFKKEATILLDELNSKLCSKILFRDDSEEDIVRNVEFFVIDNVECADVIIKSENIKFINPIDDFMSEQDYSMMYCKKGYKLPDETKIEHIHIVYCNNVPTPISLKDLYSRGIKNLYHITPTSNKDVILENGLQLKGRDWVNGIKYDPRIYFFFESDSANSYVQSMHKECNTGLFTKLIIPIESVWDVQFFYDPLLLVSRGIYTKTEIGKIDTMTFVDLPPVLSPEVRQKKEEEEAMEMIKKYGLKTLIK